MQKIIKQVLDELNTIIIGKEEISKEIIAAILADGHILIEDIPGVGKTTMANGISQLMDLKCNRIQLTPDVMPSDITGFTMYRRDLNKFTFEKGAVFCNLLLADEINRTSPKSQSALLEVMEEHQVSIDGKTYQLESPFVVIATQNPFGTIGTQQLPFAQMDRFMISLKMGYPDFANEVAIAKTITQRQNKKIAQISKADLVKIKNEIEKVYVDDSIYNYITQLVRATREHKSIKWGASPRATIALVKISKAIAWLDERDYVIPNDIISQFIFVVKHRIQLNSNSKENLSIETILLEIINNTPKPSLKQ